MIKRRFYRLEHGNRDAPSESSSSSSESEVEAEATDDTEVEEEEQDDEEEENVVSGMREKGEASSSSGYESEDSSANEVNLDSSGLPTSDDDVEAQNGGPNLTGSFACGEGDSIIAKGHHSPEKDETHTDMSDCVLKCKSVFKCRLCPRIVCLSEETLKAHLNSKRHARSEKLLREGRLKLMLNSDGQIEGEVPVENHATTTVSGQKSAKPNKKGKGRWTQRKRPRKETKSGKAKPSSEKREKRRKNDS